MEIEVPQGSGEKKAVKKILKPQEKNKYGVRPQGKTFSLHFDFKRTDTKNMNFPICILYSSTSFERLEMGSQVPKCLATAHIRRHLSQPFTLLCLESSVAQFTQKGPDFHTFITLNKVSRNETNIDTPQKYSLPRSVRLP